MRKLLIASAVAAIAVAPAAQAEVSISGQVSNVIGFGGDFDDVKVVQNGASGTRFRFKADKEMGSVKAAIRLELQDSKNVDGSNNDNDLRYADISFAGGFGKLSIGQGDGAANGVTEAYTSATGNYFAGVHGVDFALGSLETGANRFSNLDFLSRNQRIRYDSPKFGGLQLSASLRSDNGGDNATEIAARYSGKFGGTAVTLQAGSSSTDTNDTTGIAGGVHLPFGLTFGFSASDNDSTESQTLAIGYRSGKWRISAETGESGGPNGDLNQIDTIGVTYAGPVTLFAAFASVSQGAAGAGEDAVPAVEFDAPIIGARMTF